MAVIANTGRVTADISGNVGVAPTASAYANLNSIYRNSAGTTTVTVPAGHIYVLVSASIMAGTVAGGTTNVSCNIGGNVHNIINNAAAGANPITWCGQCKCNAGDTINVTLSGTAQYYDLTI